MDGDIGNELCTAPCAENSCSCCGAEFGTRCGAVVLLRRDLYGLNPASNSFQRYFGDFLRDLRFEQSRADQDLWIIKFDRYEWYDYIATHVDDVIIAGKNSSKYMHDIEIYFKVRKITDSPNYYLEMIWYKLQIVFIFHQRSMWMKFYRSTRRHMVTRRRRHYIWKLSNTLSFIITHYLIRKSTQTSNKLLGYIYVWLFQEYLNYHMLSLHLVCSRLHLGQSILI